MKHSIRAGSLLLSFVLLIVCTFGARAAAAGKFIRGYEVEGETLNIYCTALPEDGAVTLTMNKENVTAKTTTLDKAGQPVTLYCLVDVSGSMKESQMEQVKTALTEINSRMGKNDLMVLSTLGNQINSSEVLRSSAERTKAIEALEAGHEDTNLYAGIIECLNDLQTNSSYTSHRCLLVFSDGADMQDMGGTETAVYQAISQTTLPVYAVATIRDTPSQEQRDSADALCSLAKSSLGGIGLCPVLTKQTGAEAGTEIWEALQNEVILQIDIKTLAIDATKDTQLLRAEYTSGENRYTDTVEVNTDELGAWVDPSNPDSDPDPDPDPTPTHEFSIWALLVLIPIAAFIAFMILRKKTAPTPEAVEKAETLDVNEDKLEDTSALGQPVSEIEQEPEMQPPPVMPPIEPEPLASTLPITLTAIAHPEVVYNFTLPEKTGITLGRRGNVKFSEYDTSVSGLHCEMYWTENKLYLRDTASTNGTFVNGIKISGQGWVQIENSSIVRIGTYDYRVKFDG